MKYLLIFLVSTTFYISSYGQIIDTSFWDTNHDVKCFHAKGDTLFVGGSFSFVGEVNGGLLPIDIESGELVENFKRLEANITSIIPDLSGGWYIGGFTAIDTGSIANKYFPFIKHVLPDFSIDPDFSFGLSEFDYGAYSLRLWNNKLIVGGDFESIEGIFCKNLAIINTLTYEIGTFSHIPNDIINDLEISNDTIYIAGNFTQMGSAQRRGLAAFKLTTNELLDFNPNINSSQYSINVNVLSAIAIGSKLYIGGRFDSIGGIFQKNFGIVNRISGANLGTSICTDNDQNSFVKTIAIYGDTLIIGGRFDSVLNHSRYTAAAINLTNETLITSFPEFEADYFNEVTSVYKNNSNLYIAGLFRAVEDADRSNIALIDYNSFSILPWNPGVGGKVHSLAGNESILMIGGFFHTSFGEIRECIAAFNLNTSDLLPLKFYFTDLIGAPIVNGIDILDNTLYFGGKFQSVNGIDRSNAAAVDLNDGSVNNWDPSVYSFVRVLKTSVNVVYIGGIFNHVGGEPRTALAAIDAISGQVTAWNPNLQTTLSYPIVNDIEIFDDIIYIGGSFKQVNEVSRNCFAAINTNTAELEDWSPAPEDEVFDVYSIEISDDWLMIGGYFNSIYGNDMYGFAAFDLFTFELKPINPFSPDIDGYLYDIAKNENIIYCGGIISSSTYPSIDNTNSLAFHSVSGQIDESWNADFGNRAAKIAAIKVVGETVFLGSRGAPYAFTEGKRKYFMAVPESTIVGFYELNEIRNTLNVYPNPTSVSINLDLGDLNEEVKSISIYTITGQESIIIKDPIVPKFSYDIKNLDNGIYYFSINGEKTILSTGKFIKQ